MLAADERQREIEGICARAAGLPVPQRVIADALSIRRELHAEPELSNHENRTARRLRDALERGGLTDFRSVAGTGFAVDIAGAQDGPTVVLRGDIDALPIQEEAELPWVSRRPGVMHACGHDAHASMVYAVALALNQERERLGGTVRCIFQPAEEAEPLGGRRVVEEGHLDGVAGALGIHVDPSLPTGVIGVMPGVYSCSSDEFEIEIRGVSAHAAAPHDGVDAIAIASTVVVELQLIAARERDPRAPLVISVGSMHGGDAHNVLCDHVRLGGTIRATDPATRDLAADRLAAVATGVAERHGGAAAVTMRRGEPPVINDPEMVRLLTEAAHAVGGHDAVIAEPAWSASDDFGFYAERVPSVYFRLGVRPAGAEHAFPLHHPQFVVDEEALPLGAAILVEATRAFLNPDRKVRQ